MRSRIAILGVTGLAALAGCSGKSAVSGEGTGQMGLMATGGVPSYDTYLHNGEEVTYIGQRKYSDQARQIMSGFPLSGIDINDAGYCTGFTPALPPAIIPPAVGVPLAWVKFDADGRLIGYEYAAEMAPACTVIFVNPAYACQNNACVSPKMCILTEWTDPQGGFHRSCDCTQID